MYVNDISITGYWAGQELLCPKLLSVCKWCCVLENWAGQELLHPKLFICM